MNGRVLAAPAIQVKHDILVIRDLTSQVASEALPDFIVVGVQLLLHCCQSNLACFNSLLELNDFLVTLSNSGSLLANELLLLL